MTLQEGKESGMQGPGQGMARHVRAEQDRTGQGTIGQSRAGARAKADSVQGRAVVEAVAGARTGAVTGQRQGQHKSRVGQNGGRGMAEQGRTG